MDYKAFTAKFNGITREIITDVGISMPFVAESIDANDERIVRTTALWDTGATNCVITKKTATAMGLKPISVTRVCHAGGESFPYVYLINIYLPNNNVIESVRVTECDDAAGNFGIIIGMDVITLGDFSVTNKEKQTVFSFRIPSINTIDYVQEARELMARKFKNVKPNDPCPCGSGKKFKQCHKKQM